ncbi:MAG: DUF3990 domain-containing protein [Oscillospiraceae bacterium]|nr:DUF3990 domain-containing protein [Oscillospiraceae bacterium]
MALYHGTNSKISAIDLNKGRARTDFGKGFYLAGKLETANRWAANRVDLSGGTATVLRYEINNDLFRTHGKRFSDIPELDWLEFICQNRHRKAKDAENMEPRHDYNWVSGPIADDQVYDVVKGYMSGEISAEVAVQKARALPQTFQLSLHTTWALSFVDDAGVYFKQYTSNGWSRDWIKREG